LHVFSYDARKNRDQPLFLHLLARIFHEYIVTMIQQNGSKASKAIIRDSHISVGVAMSGGVDSSVTATLLKKRGYDVHGFFMALAQPDLEKQIERVKNIAGHLHIPLTVVELQDEFHEAVLAYFTQSYFQGQTPNPCVVCNATIKFGSFLAKILATGCDCMATGHYARIVKTSDGLYHLMKGVDPQKDQSYFLHRLNQGQLARILMPLGEETKANVYKLAAELGISGVHGEESQDVCFLKGRDLNSFLSRYSPARSVEGPIVTLRGKEIGRHPGIQNFTVGQRKGLGIPDATPYYVVALDPKANAVMVGKKADLWQRQLTVGDVNWIAGKEPPLPHNFFTRIRYRHKGAPARMETPEKGLYPLRFQEPQLAITPGQFAVFYEGVEVIGGGVIL
jgi:tRNA-specific 2-thiouridylase